MSERDTPPQHPSSEPEPQESSASTKQGQAVQQAAVCRVKNTDRPLTDAVRAEQLIAEARQWAGEMAAENYQADSELLQAIADALASAQQRIAALEQEVEDEDRLRERLTAILNGVTDALKGKPPELVRYSWHDLPEVATQLQQRIQDLEQLVGNLPQTPISRA